MTLLFFARGKRINDTFPSRPSIHRKRSENKMFHIGNRINFQQSKLQDSNWCIADQRKMDNRIAGMDSTTEISHAVNTRLQNSARVPLHSGYPTSTRFGIMQIARNSAGQQSVTKQQQGFLK